MGFFSRLKDLSYLAKELKKRGEGRDTYEVLSKTLLSQYNSLNAFNGTTLRQVIDSELERMDKAASQWIDSLSYDPSEEDKEMYAEWDKERAVEIDAIQTRYPHLMSHDDYYAQYEGIMDNDMVAHVSFPTWEEYIETEKVKYYDDGSPRPQIHWNK